MIIKTITSNDVKNIIFQDYLRLKNFTITQASGIRVIGDEGINVPIPDYYIVTDNGGYHANYQFLWEGNSESVAAYVNMMNEFMDKWK